MPALVLSLCEGETVEAVTLSDFVNTDEKVGSGRILWRIEADDPQGVDRFVVGEVPDGYVEVTPLSELTELMILESENAGEAVGAHHGESFHVGDLEPGVLTQLSTRR